MEGNSFLAKTLNETLLSRRSFLKWSAVLGGTAAMAGGVSAGLAAAEKAAEDSGEKKIRVGCPAHNCGGRCLLIATVNNGVITRIGTDDRPTDELDDPLLRACPRGRSYRRRQYHPDRLQYPMKRVGKRGEAKFERISWDEAYEIITSEMERVKKTYGNSAFYVPYGTGSYNQIGGAQTAQRLLAQYGGYLGMYNNYSWASIQRATPVVYGTQMTGNQRQDWVNSKYIIMWGWNPAEMRDGTNSEYFVQLAREKGAKVVCIDPRQSLSAVGLADEYIAIRPGTDTAMMSAMAYVMITEGIYDAEFVNKYCVGFDKSQMPEGYENEETYSDYILGTVDGVAKTPEWAEKITAVPAATIIRIAREYATIKPGVLYQGYGMQRRAFGEEVVKAGCVLPALTGNVGISGGWAGGIAFQAPDWGPFWNLFPGGDNPVKASIPCFLWTEAVLRGKEMTAKDGVVGVDKLDNDIKFIFAVATNHLNQHGNINRTADILADESKVEFIVHIDQFITPSMRYADVILPGATQFESYGAEDGWKYGDEVILMPKVVEPLGECKSDYQICADIATKLGFGDQYTEGRTERDWIAWVLEQYKATRFPDVPMIDEFEKSNIGVFTNKITKPAIAFEAFRADPEANPLDTKSGKIELFSSTLFDMGRPDDIPAVPKYIQEWESPFGPEAKKYPLQVFGHHYLHRVHSTHDNVDWLEEAFPQRVFINNLDAAARGIKTGDIVRVYNERGIMEIPCRVTKRIMPGVVDVPTGGWWTPDENGIDRRGAINVLTSEIWTPLAFGNAQHTAMVQVEKA